MKFIEKLKSWVFKPKEIRIKLEAKYADEFIQFMKEAGIDVKRIK